MKRYTVMIDGEVLLAREVADEELKDFISSIGIVCTLQGKAFKITNWDTGEVVAKG